VLERAIFDGQIATLPLERGRFRLLSRLGRGGMAEVFLAEMSGAAGFLRRVVVKRVRSELAHVPLYVEMFEREARVLSRLHHPNIVVVLDFCDVVGEHWLVLEHIDGPSLQTILRERNRLALEPACAFVAEAARGLHAVHSARDVDGSHLSLVHRDISPDNICVTSSGTVKLLDFGIAKGRQSESLTSVGTIKGKVSYMAPETIRLEPLDGRSDLFALGVVFYEALTGRRPFEGSGALVMNAILNDAPAPPSTLVPALPAALDRLVLQMLAKDPDERPASGAAVADAIHAIVPLSVTTLARVLAERSADDVSTAGARAYAEAVSAPTVSRPKAKTKSSSDAVAQWAQVTSLEDDDDDDVVTFDEETGAVSRLRSAEHMGTVVARPRPRPARPLVAAGPPEGTARVATRGSRPGVLLVGGALLGALGIVATGQLVSGAKDTAPSTQVPVMQAQPVPAIGPASPRLAPAFTSRLPPSAAARRSVAPSAAPALVAQPIDDEPAARGGAAVTRRTKASSPARRSSSRASEETNIFAVPYARVFIDDRDVGDTPLTGLRLTVGRHRMRFVFPDGRIVVRDANIRAGRTNTMSARADE
jgi:serine/threonine-protein kinase